MVNPILMVLCTLRSPLATATGYYAPSVGRSLFSGLCNNADGLMRSTHEMMCNHLLFQQQRTFIQMRTSLKVVDNSGAKRVACIQALKGKKGARLGDTIVCSVKEAQPGGKVKKGEVHYGVVVRAAMPRGRCDGSEVKFDDNAVSISPNVSASWLLAHQGSAVSFSIPSRKLKYKLPCTVIPPEPPLLPPTLLKGTSFDSFDYQAIGFEFDILAFVINGSPPSYASNGSRIHEFIIIDYQKKPTKLTLWEEFIDLYGNKLLKHLKELQDFPKQLLPLIPVQHKLLGKTFTIQMKKLFAKHKDASSAKLFIMSITEEDIASNLPLPLTAPTTPESSKRKLKQTKED
ncbi:hypothetical protein KY289_019180 [Solanum tuberosum]|nr:hypothetical protein KY289_019180 [Solanum tuberosum]